MTTFGISKEVVVTLKYYYEKNKRVVETTLKCLFLKVPLENSLDIRIKSYFKVVSTTDSALWHIQNPRYIGKPVNIPCETLAYIDHEIRQIWFSTR